MFCGHALRRWPRLVPGLRDEPGLRTASKKNAKLEFFGYWCSSVKGLGFEYRGQMPS